MELLHFIQTQTYYFPQEPNELQQILNLEQNKDLLYSINQNTNIVQYHFNQQQWICLSDLLKTKVLVSQVLAAFSIERENVELSIIIVGHGCPIFENRDFKAQDDEISITSIIKNILGLIKYTFREYAEKSEILYDISQFNQLQQLNLKLHNEGQITKLGIQFESIMAIKQLFFFKFQIYQNEIYFLQQALPSLIEGLDYYLYFKTVSIDDQMILEFDQLIQSTLKFNITSQKLLKIVNNKISSLNSRLNQNTRIQFSIKTDELQKLIYQLELDDLKLYAFNSLKSFKIKFKELLTSFIEFKIELLFNQFIEEQISNIFDSLH